MIIDLIALESSPHSFNYEFSPEEIELDGENVILKNSVEVEGTLTKKIVQVDVKGEIFADAELECTRCLEKVEKKLEIPFETAFVTEENFTAAKEAELNHGDLNVSVFGGDKIDLTELVREQILLNLPEQVFCRENCRGLCEKCGANRNTTDCSCEEKEADPRWSALKNLK